MGPELSFMYDANIHPVGGKCSACGEDMPEPPTEPRDNVDAILWLAHSFLVHKNLKHSSAESYIRDSRTQ